MQKHRSFSTKKCDSKWISMLNVKCRDIKVPGDIIVENLSKFGFGYGFLDITSNA